MAHQIRTISKQRLKGLLDYLEDPQIRDEVCAAIKEHLGLD
jgi:mRNA-degrading endonuclease toxin of MazEF toxin-antitoxin module